jgi:hypothetical protein
MPAMAIQKEQRSSVQSGDEKRTSLLFFKENINQFFFF